MGKPLVERLVLMGYSVTALGMRQKISPFDEIVEYACGDLADTKSALALLQPWRWDAIVNLAGPVPREQTTCDDEQQILSKHVNVALSVSLAIPQSWSGRLLHVSSMAVYGFPEWLPVNESHPRKPINWYGVAKVLAEDIVLGVAQMNRLDCWLLRLPGLFSEGRRNGILFDLMRSAAKGHPLVISRVRPIPWDILHVGDAVEAIARVLIADDRGSGAINIGYGVPVGLLAIAEKIAARAGTKVILDNIVGLQYPNFQMDIGKASSLLQWPPITLDARLEDMWNALLGEVHSL